MLEVLALMLHITNLSPAFFLLTGALVVTGGIGASGAINSGNAILATGTITTQNASVASSGTTGALRCSGGAGIAGNLWVGTTAEIGTTLTWGTTGRSVYTFISEQALSGTTNVLWSNIPSTHRDVVINFENLGATASAHPLIQIGNNGGFVATGYESEVFRNGAQRNDTTGVPLYTATISGLTSYMHGSITIRLVRNYTSGSNYVYDYFIFGNIVASVAGAVRTATTGAYITLSGLSANAGVLDRVKLLLSASSFNQGVASLAYC